MTDTIVIRIDGRPPMPNRAVRNVWQANRRAADDWKQRAWTEATLAKPHGWVPLERATMAVEFVVPDRRRRDLDGLISSTKNLTDGIVAAGILVDDNTDVLVSVAYTVRYEKGVAATVYRVEAA